MIPMWIYTVPFIEGGRDRKGVDCWGLLVLLFKEFMDTELPTYSGIAYKGGNHEEAAFDLQRLRDTQDIFYEVDEPKFGDIVLLTLLGRPLHVGFAINKTEMIHIAPKCGVVLENFRGGKWRRKIVGFYRAK